MERDDGNCKNPCFFTDPHKSNQSSQDNEKTGQFLKPRNIIKGYISPDQPHSKHHADNWQNLGK